MTDHPPSGNYPVLYPGVYGQGPPHLQSEAPFLTKYKGV